MPVSRRAWPQPTGAPPIGRLSPCCSRVAYAGRKRRRFAGATCRTRRTGRPGRVQRSRVASGWHRPGTRRHQRPVHRTAPHGSGQRRRHRGANHRALRARRPCRRIDQARRTRAGDGQGGRVEVVTDGCPLRGGRSSRAGRRRYLPVAGARAARRTSGAPHRRPLDAPGRPPGAPGARPGARRRRSISGSGWRHKRLGHSDRSEQPRKREPLARRTSRIYTCRRRPLGGRCRREVESPYLGSRSP